MFSRFLTAALSVLLAGCAALSMDREPAGVFRERRVASPIVESAQECREHLAGAGRAVGNHGFGPRLTLATWNTQKSTDSLWRSELRNLARRTDLLLLQEAAIVPAAREVLPYPFVAVAEGYHSTAGPTGVLTASNTEPLGSCTFLVREPLLRTFKASSVTRYPIAGREETLLVANIHSVNFSLGMGAFDRQLLRLAATLKNHRGPIIFAGDFNVWNSRRERVVERIMESLGLTEARLRPDLRKRVFGHPLDRIYWRDLELLSAGTRRLPTSDHSALLATFQSVRDSPDPAP